MKRTIAILVALSLVGCYRSYQISSERDVGFDPLPEPEPEPEPDPVVEPEPDPVPDPIVDDVEEEVCAETAFAVWRLVPDVLVVLDRSNSMGDTPPIPPMWDTIRAALEDITEPPRDASIWFGLMSFPGPACRDDGDPITGCMAPAPRDIHVGVAPDNHRRIETALDGLRTCGGTPIAGTLETAGDYLGGLADHHPKYILLATDGAPNCNDALDGDTCTCTSSFPCTAAVWNCLDDVRTYAILDELCEDDILTYVLGLGAAAEWAEVQEQMASHGCTESSYLAEEPSEINAALEAIADEVETCQLEMYCSELTDPDEVNFYTEPGHVLVPRDTSHTAGWDWIDPCGPGIEIGLVEFFGVDCTVLFSDDLDNLSPTTGCPTVII